MKQCFFVLVFFVFIILTVGTLYATNNVEEVGDWWGTVTINGVSGNNGAVIDAYIDENKVASATVGEYEIDYYLIHVEGQEGNEVLFKVNGKEAETQGWSNGDHELDLEVSIDTTIHNNDDGGSPGGGSPSGDSPIITTSETTGTQTTNGNISLNSDKNQKTTGPGITGGVIGFLGSGKGIAAIVVLIVLGVGVILIKSKTPKWIKKP